MSKRKLRSFDGVLSVGRYGTPIGPYCTCLEDRPCPVHYKAESTARAALGIARVALLECLGASLLSLHEGPLFALLESLDIVRGELSGMIDGGGFKRELSRLEACAKTLLPWGLNGSPYIERDHQ